MSPLGTALSQPGSAAVRGRGGRHRGQLRILPAEDREDGGDALGEREDAGAARRRASSRSPTAPAARPASAPTPPSRASSARPPIHAAAHLTCVEASRGEIDEIARAYWEAGVRHIVALRGDPPEPGKPFAPHPDGYANAADLVAGLKQVAPFEISVAGLSRMPSGFARRGRRSRQSQAQDRCRRRPGDHPVLLLARAASSASATQVAAAGIDAEIMPGILPVSNVAQTRKFAAMCGAAHPRLAGPAVRGAGRSARRAPARRRDRRRRALRASSMRAASANSISTR